jgi:hypothetical protein
MYISQKKSRPVHCYRYKRLNFKVPTHLPQNYPKSRRLSCPHFFSINVKEAGHSPNTTPFFPWSRGTSHQNLWSGLAPLIRIHDQAWHLSSEFMIRSGTSHQNSWSGLAPLIGIHHRSVFHFFPWSGLAPLIRIHHRSVFHMGTWRTTLRVEPCKPSPVLR